MLRYNYNNKIKRICMLLQFFYKPLEIGNVNVIIIKNLIILWGDKDE